MQCACRSPDWPGIASPHSNKAWAPSKASSLVRKHIKVLKYSEWPDRIGTLGERYVNRVSDDEETLKDLIEGLRSESFHSASGCAICIAEITSQCTLVSVRHKRAPWDAHACWVFEGGHLGWWTIVVVLSFDGRGSMVKQSGAFRELGVDSLFDDKHIIRINRGWDPFSVSLMLRESQTSFRRWAWCSGLLFPPEVRRMVSWVDGFLSRKLWGFLVWGRRSSRIPAYSFLVCLFISRHTRVLLLLA